MKKNTIIVLVAAAAVAGVAAWLFGTEKGKKTLAGIQENLDETGAQLKTSLDCAKKQTAEVIEKGKEYMRVATNGIKKAVS